MAATYTYSGSFSVALTSAYTQALALTSDADQLQTGAGNFSKIAQSLTPGTGPGQAGKHWHDRRTVTAGANDDLVLGAGGSLTNAFGAVTFTSIKWFLLRIVTPATGVRLVIGAAGTNPAALWFGATTHTEECRSVVLKENQIDGWTVAANGTLRVNNPTGASIIYDILVVGN